MKIVFVLAQGSISAGGGFRIIAGYADKLADRGHEVTLVAPGGVKQKPKTLRQRFRQLRGKSAPLTNPNVRPYLQNDDVKIVVLKDKAVISPSDMPEADVLIATWWKTAEWVHAVEAPCAKFHLIQDHEVFPYLPAERTRSVHLLPLRKIVVSRWLQKEMAESYDINDAILIENVIEKEKFESDDRAMPADPVVGFLYSRTERKNAPLAIAACQLLKARIPNLRGVAFGVAKPKSNVKFPGWIDFHVGPTESEIARIYQSTSVWLFTSNTEGFGLPILEAMASGAPVVATPAGAAPELVNENNGALVGHSADEIADAAERILALPPDAWRKISAAASATAGRRSWDEAADEFEAAIMGAGSAE